jgi:hypothetical protein
MTKPEGHYITLFSELMALTIVFLVLKTCGPLGMGGLGSQPFEVSETFSTPQHFNTLFTYGTILVNSSGVQLQLADMGVDIGEFGVIFSVVEEVCSNPPVFELLCKLNYIEELGVWTGEYGPEPLRHWAS